MLGRKSDPATSTRAALNHFESSIPRGLQWLLTGASQYGFKRAILEKFVSATVAAQRLLSDGAPSQIIYHVDEDTWFICMAGTYIDVQCAYDFAVYQESAQFLRGLM